MCENHAFVLFRHSPTRFFTPRAACSFHAAFRPFEKWRTLQKKTTPLQIKRTVFCPGKGEYPAYKSRKKYPREKRHHVLAQPRAKRHTPTWTNVPEACTTDSIIYRKINSTTKGTSYPQKEPSPLGWAISPKKKEARAKKNKNDRFSTRSRGCGAAEPTTQEPRWGGEEGGTEGRERAKWWEENRQSHKKRAKRKACAEKTVNLQAN